jgi:7-cyano-7-deazaguanine synthase
MKKAVVLLSGGMDSAVALYMAKKDYEVQSLIFDYGQRAENEIDCAIRVSEAAGCPYTILDVDLPWGGSSIIDVEADIPSGEISASGKIPSTYVPARNILFLSYGVSFAEATGAEAVFIGAHQLDYSNYPDCRGDFFESFQETIKRGTRAGVEGSSIKIVTPILDFTKKAIVEKGCELGVPFELTWSCYKGGASPCDTCESCMLRTKAFGEAGVVDPIA